jgi:alpha-1,2-mannosyltransferase
MILAIAWITLLPLLWIYLLPKLVSFQRKNLKLSKKRPVVAFFHPFCDGGGGGERVLWTAIHGLLEAKTPVQIVLYVSDKVPIKGDLVKLVNVKCLIT